MTLLEIVVVVSAFIALTLPYFEQRIRDRNIKFDKWLFLFTISAFITLVGGFGGLYKSNQATRDAIEVNSKILSTIVREAQRISPSDFQMQVISSIYGSLLKGNPSTPSQLYVFGTLRSAYFTCVLNYTPVENYSTGHDPNKNFIYYGQNISFDLLDRYQYLHDLDGDTLQITLPIRKIELVKGPWNHRLNFYIKGRSFLGIADSRGKVKIPLTFK